MRVWLKKSSPIMGPQAEDYIETVLTCEGDYYDPEFHAHLQKFSQKLEALILQDEQKKKLILKKVEPWNSVRVTFNIPKEAALRLKCLAEQGDTTLKELGILAVEIEGDRKISLKIAGINNETTELVFRTGVINKQPVVGTGTTSAFDLNSSDEMNVAGPSSNVENTRKNIVDYLGQGAAELFGNILATNAPACSKSSMVSNTAGVSPNSNPQGPNFAMATSQMSPKFPTPPPSVSTPNSPNGRGVTPVSTGMGGQQNNPFVQNIVKQILGNKSSAASPLLVNLLQNESIAAGMHLNNVNLSQLQALNAFPQAINSMLNPNMNKAPMPGDAGPAPPPKKKRRTRKPKDKDGQVNKRSKTQPHQTDTNVFHNTESLYMDGVPHQDLRVPPLGMEASPFIGSQGGMSSKMSTPSSSRAATPARSPCPAPPKSPVSYQTLAPGQRHIINPTTGLFEVDEEDIGFTPPKRDLVPKENQLQDGLQIPLQFSVPNIYPPHQMTAFNKEHHFVSATTSNDIGSVLVNQRSSPGSLQRRTSDGIEFGMVPRVTSYNSNFDPCTGNSLGSSTVGGVTMSSLVSNVLTSAQNMFVQSSVSQTVVNSDFSKSNSNVSTACTMPQTISAILSNVSKSSGIALAALNLPSVQNSVPTSSSMHDRSPNFLNVTQPRMSSQGSVVPLKNSFHTIENITSVSNPVIANEGMNIPTPGIPPFHTTSSNIVTPGMLDQYIQAARPTLLSSSALVHSDLPQRQHTDLGIVTTAVPSCVISSQMATSQTAKYESGFSQVQGATTNINSTISSSLSSFSSSMGPRTTASNCESVNSTPGLSTDSNVVVTSNPQLSTVPTKKERKKESLSPITTTSLQLSSSLSGIQSIVVDQEQNQTAGSTLESTHLVGRNIVNGGGGNSIGSSNIQTTTTTHSGINSELTHPPHPHDSEHSSQSCEDHVKVGSGSVDSGLGDIKSEENNGESPCGSSGNDSPGVTVSTSSGNRDSDIEKERDFPPTATAVSTQSETKNVITVGYVMSKSGNPAIEKTVCDTYTKCNHETIVEELAQKQFPGASVNADNGINKAPGSDHNSYINMPSLLKLTANNTARGDSDKVLVNSVGNTTTTNLSQSLNWLGRSDLNPGGGGGGGGGISTITNGEVVHHRLSEKDLGVVKQLVVAAAAEMSGSGGGGEEICNDQSSSVQVCSNDATVLAEMSKCEVKFEGKVKPLCDVSQNNNIHSEVDFITNTVQSIKSTLAENQASLNIPVANVKSKTESSESEIEESRAANEEIECTVLVSPTRAVSGNEEMVSPTNTENEDVELDIQDIQLYSEVKVTDDNTVIIDTKELTVCSNQLASAFENVLSSKANQESEINDESNIISGSDKPQYVDMDSMVPVSVVVSPQHIEEVNTNSNDSLRLTTDNIEGNLTNNGNLSSVDNQEVLVSPSVEGSVNSVCNASSPATTSITTNPIVVAIDSSKNVETSMIETNSSVNNITSLSVTTQTESNYITRSVSVITVQGDELKYSAVTSISTIAPSLGCQQVNRATCAVSSAIMPHGMASLGPSPIMSTGLPYFNAAATNTPQATAVLPVEGDKTGKGVPQKGISIMKPLRDRESSIDEDLLESPLKNKMSPPLKKGEKSVEKGPASVVNKRANFTVAQLLDEAEKVKQNQTSIFRPFVGTESHENLFPQSITTTASAQLKQIAKNVVDKTEIINENLENLNSSSNSSSSKHVNKSAVPNLLKISVTYAEDMPSNSISTILQQPSAIISPPAKVDPDYGPLTSPRLTPVKFNSANIVGIPHAPQENMTITMPDIHLNIPPESALSTPVSSPNLVSVTNSVSSLHSIYPQSQQQAANPAAKTLPGSCVSESNNSVKLPSTGEFITLSVSTGGVYSPRQILSPGNAVLVPPDATPITVGKKSPVVGEFIKLVPESVPANKNFLKNIIVKSSPNAEKSTINNNSGGSDKKISLPDRNKPVYNSVPLDSYSSLNSNVLTHEHSYSARPGQQKSPTLPIVSTTHTVTSAVVSPPLRVIPVENSQPVDSHRKNQSFGIVNASIVSVSSGQSLKISPLNKHFKSGPNVSSVNNERGVIVQDVGKTLTISGTSGSSVNESSTEMTPQVTLDLRSAVTSTNPISSGTKFIKFEPGNRFSSNITVKVKSELHKDNVVDAGKVIRVSEPELRVMSPIVSNPVLVQVKTEAMAVKASPLNVQKQCDTVNPVSTSIVNTKDHMLNYTGGSGNIQGQISPSFHQDDLVGAVIPQKSWSLKRKSSESSSNAHESDDSLQPPSKSIRLTNRVKSLDRQLLSNDLELFKPASRISRKRSRGSTDSKTSSDGTHDEDLSSRPSRRSSINRTKSLVDSSEHSSSSELVTRRGSVSSNTDRSASPSTTHHQTTSRNSTKSTRLRKSHEKESDPSTAAASEQGSGTRRSSRHKTTEDSNSKDNSTGVSPVSGGRSDVPKLNKVDDGTNDEVLLMDETGIGVVGEDSDMVGRKGVTSSSRPARGGSSKVKHNNLEIRPLVNQVDAIAPSDIIGFESSSAANKRRSTRSSQAVEHCELPNNYIAKPVTKKKQKIH